MRELFFPRTDAGVVFQASIVFPVLLIVLVLLRRDRELRIFVLGVFMVVLAFFGLRALH